ncbi:MAG: response regulator [Acidobacteriota bacterium]
MKKRVLVVDDESSIRVLVARVLTRHGYDVSEAEDGQEAIDILQTSGPYDALVLDLMMPRVDGFGVLDYLVEHRPEMVEKTVVATAYPRTALRQRLHQVCHVISKPFEIALLISSVEACAGMSELPAAEA